MEKIKTKIINIIKGGLGNQLFQYVFGKTLSNRFDLPLYNDIDYYKIDPYGFSSKLLAFDNPISFINASRVGGVNSYILSDGQISSVEEIERIPEQIQNLLLNGYWQSESYFDKGIANEVYKNIAHHIISDGVGGDFDKFERGVKSVALHIRRHDYGHMGLCKNSYYLGAMEFFAQKFVNCKFYVFSDEPNYAKHLLSRQKYNFEIVNTGSDVKDLYCMSLCENFIISNSTYSWWGAWFAESSCLSKDTIVIAPKEWVLVENFPSPCPTRWIQVPESVAAFEDDSARNVDVLNSIHAIFNQANVM